MAAPGVVSGRELEVLDVPGPRVTMEVPVAVAGVGGPAPLYVLARLGPSGVLQAGTAKLVLETAILAPRSKAAVLAGKREIRPQDLEALLGRLRGPVLSVEAMERFGEELGRLLLLPAMLEAIHYAGHAFFDAARPGPRACSVMGTRF